MTALSFPALRALCDAMAFRWGMASLSQAPKVVTARGTQWVSAGMSHTVLSALVVAGSRQGGTGLTCSGLDQGAGHRGEATVTSKAVFVDPGLSSQFEITTSPGFC